MRVPSGENEGWKLSAMPLSRVLARTSPPPMGRSQISPTRSIAIVPPSGATSTDIQVLSSVVKLMVRVAPRGVEMSQSTA